MPLRSPLSCPGPRGSSQLSLAQSPRLLAGTESGQRGWRETGNSGGDKTWVKLMPWNRIILCLSPTSTVTSCMTTGKQTNNNWLLGAVEVSRGLMTLTSSLWRLPWGDIYKGVRQTVGCPGAFHSSLQGTLSFHSRETFTTYNADPYSRWDNCAVTVSVLGCTDPATEPISRALRCN